MASVKVLLKINQPKKDGTYPILIRVISNRVTRYFSVGHSVKESQFKDGVVVRHPDLVLINRAIEKKRSELAAKVFGNESDVLQIGRKSLSFVQAIKRRMMKLEETNQVPMYNRLKAKCKIINGIDVPLNKLSAKWVENYVSTRLKDGTKVSTIKKDLTDFTTVLSNTPEYEGKDWFALAQKKLKAEDPIKEKLTLDEIKELEKVRLEGLNDIARDMFLFSFYCHGMRFQNVAMFEKSMIKNGLIRYRMNKGKKIREIVVHAKLQNIINKYDSSPYLFPIIKREIKDNWEKKQLVDSANALINAHLKRVAIIAGIDKNLSMHIARHTFAYLSLERGVTVEVLKDALGHSDYKTTQVYLKSLSDQQINEAVTGLYD